MKRVLHIIVGLEVGGAELMLARLVTESSRHSRGYCHAIVSLTQAGPLGEGLRAAGIEVHALGMHSYASLPLALWRLQALIRRQRPDIVQTWMYHADLLGGLAARLAGVRTVIWGIRTTEFSAGGVARVTQWVRWLCARLSRWLPQRIVCAAEASRRLHVALGYDAARMVVVSNGFDPLVLSTTPEQVQAVRSSCGWGADTLVLGAVGRFNPDKDFRNFVRAAGLLAPRFPALRFLLVGRGCDAANEDLRDWIAQAGCPDRFALLGRRADMPACLAAMDVFCLSSRTEGFPNVLGEAMAMGRPCVATDVGDAALLLDDCGIVVPREDAVALAEGVARLLASSAAERLALGERARQRIEAEFTMARARERFEAVYAGMLAPAVTNNRQG